MKDKNKAKKITLISVGVLVLIIIAVYVGVSLYFSTHFLSGSTINGIKATGKTVDQIKQSIREQIGKYTLTVEERDGVTETITADDIRLEYVDDNKVDQLMEEQNPWLWFQSFTKQKSFEMAANTTYDDAALVQRIDALTCLQNMTAPADAYLKENDNGYEIVPEVKGNTIDKDKMTELIKTALDEGKTTVSITDPDCYTYPTVYSDNESLISRRDAWNKYLSISLTYTFGKDKEVINKDVIKPWIQDDGTTLTLNTDGVSALVYEWAKKYDTFGLPREFKTHAGNTITLQSGDYGWVINRDKTTEAIKASLEAGESGEKEVVYRYSAMSRDNNDLGGTYVEVSISEQRMWCYKDYQVIVDTPIVTGLLTADRATTPGCWAIDAKKRDATLGSLDVQGYASPVKFWMPFNGGQGIHDADGWRTEYGGDIYKTNGSHGCVNTPLTDVEKIYNTVQIGTAVCVY
ncbi:MAG: peptidoglycan binding domain-containing protein [Lachnospiraceae bacterium]|nr:peptidoglycan binding domain-containing protein [Lachnospiraceae bacterium]